MEEPFSEEEFPEDKEMIPSGLGKVFLVWGLAFLLIGGAVFTGMNLDGIKAASAALTATVQNAVDTVEGTTTVMHDSCKIMSKSTYTYPATGDVEYRVITSCGKFLVVGPHTYAYLETGGTYWLKATSGNFLSRPVIFAASDCPF